MVGEPQSSVAAEVISPWPATWGQQAAGYRRAVDEPGSWAPGVTAVTGMGGGGSSGVSGQPDSWCRVGSDQHDMVGAEGCVAADADAVRVRTVLLTAGVAPSWASEAVRLRGDALVGLTSPAKLVQQSGAGIGAWAPEACGPREGGSLEGVHIYGVSGSFSVGGAVYQGVAVPESEVDALAAAARQAEALLRRRVDEYAAGAKVTSAHVAIAPQSVVECPNCRGMFGVPGAELDPLVFRVRCARCAWMSMSWDAHTIPGAPGEGFPVGQEQEAVWFQLLWGRCVRHGQRCWLQVVHEDTVLGVVCWTLALVLRELVAKASRLMRSETGVMWFMVVWLRRWVVPSGVWGASWRLPWCVDYVDGELEVRRWEGPCEGRPLPDDPVGHPVLAPVGDLDVPLEPAQDGGEGYWEDWLEGAGGDLGEVESEGYVWAGGGAEVNMLDGGALECLDSEGSWGRRRGLVEPDCYVSGPSAQALGGTLNGVGGSGATATIEQRRNVCVQQHVVDESWGHKMDALGKATVATTRDCGLYGAGSHSCGSQHASLEAQGAPGAGRGIGMSLASEGVALSHMLPVMGTPIGVGGPGGQQVADREDTVLTGSEPRGVMGGHAADGHRGATGVQSSVSLGMGGSARSRDAGVANADGGLGGLPPFEGPGVGGELRALPFTLSEESSSDSIPGRREGSDPRLSPQRVWDPGLCSGGGRPGIVEQRESGEAPGECTVIDARSMADSEHAVESPVGPEGVWEEPPLRVGAWGNRRTRAEKLAQHHEVAGLPLRVVQLVQAAVESWDMSRVLPQLTVGLDGGQWSPWPTGWSYPTMVWDTTVELRHLEQGSAEMPWSPHTPLATDRARVQAPSTLRADWMWHLLRGHPHRVFLAHGACWGYPMLAQLEPRRETHAQRPFEGEQRELVNAGMLAALASGKAVRVNEVMHRMPALIVTPVVVAPKEGAVGRICHHLSAGGHASVNASMDTAPLEPMLMLHPADTVTALRFVAEQHPGEDWVLFRLDLKAFFQQFPWRVREAWLTGQVHEGVTMVHRFATYGGSTTPGVASILSNAICDLMARRGRPCWLRVFIDDFVGLCRRLHAAEDIADLRRFLWYFGSVENVPKFMGPASVMPVLGHLVDVPAGRVWVTEQRSARITSRLDATLARRTVPTSDLRKLCGVLVFISAVVPWGRAHLSPVWTALADAARRKRGHCSVTCTVRSALEWWAQVLRGDRFRVSSFDVGVHPDRPLFVVVGVRSDASTRWGGGGVSGAHGLFMRTEWTKGEIALGIVVLEGLMSLFLLLGLGPVLSGSMVVFQSDNAGVVFALLKEHSRDARMCAVLMALCEVQERFRFRVVLGHTSTLDMGAPDGLSHGDEPSLCLPWRQGGWRECLIPLRVRAASWDACVLSPLGPNQVLGPSAIQEWRRSIGGLVSSLGGSVESYHLQPVPFFPFRTWEVVINEAVVDVSRPSV